MFNKTIKIFNIAGIEIRLDFSWFWIFLLVCLSLYFASGFLKLNIFLHIILALISAGLFFASVLLHELSHTYIAKRNGTSVSSITLFIFGGVSNLSNEPKTPKAELLMAGAGPLMSVILGFLFLLFFEALKFNPVANWLFINMSYLNFLLAIFNIIPAYPLDGGRVFRSYIWAKTGNLEKATELASLMGKFFSALIVILGVVQLIFLGTISGLWLIFIGIFIYRMAAAGPLEIKLMRQMQDITVADIRRDYPTFTEKNDDFQETKKAAINGFFEYIILKNNSGEIIGLLPIEKFVGNDIASGVIPIKIVSKIDINASLLNAIQKIQESDLTVLQIINHNDFDGILSIQDILRFTKK